MTVFSKTILSPRRVVQLFAGLILYGISMAFMVESALGLDPWDVFHQGLARTTGLSFGWVVILVGIPVLLLWIPLRQKPGFGTVANVVVIGLVVDGALALLPAAGPMAVRTTYLVTGIVLNGVASGMYIGANLGPGPRDGLMTGIVRRFPRVSVRLARTGIEGLVLVAGFLLGGTIGIGTVAYALAIGPLVQLFLPRFTIAEPPAAARPGPPPAAGPAGPPADAPAGPSAAGSAGPSAAGSARPPASACAGRSAADG